jgi:hypothetical protein
MMKDGVIGNPRAQEGGKRNKYTHIKFVCIEHGSIIEKHNGRKRI